MAESNLSIRNWCIACGHYHFPEDWDKRANACTVAVNDSEQCECTPKKFVARGMKGSFA